MPVAINYGTGFSSAWPDVAFLIIVAAGWPIAKVISAVPTRVGFDKLPAPAPRAAP